MGHQRYDYDVLVIGAGGAGLRAAIEASAAGVSVGLVCKSLLGKAHTVMAEGGMAAAMAHNDDRDSWKVHFADTMRGGQYVNNWRMAYDGVTCLNRWHMKWAWASLVMVMFADLYVRLCSMGIWTDWRIL